MALPSNQPLCGGDALPATATLQIAKEEPRLGIPTTALSTVVTRGNPLSFNGAGADGSSGAAVNEKNRTTSIVSDISTAAASSCAPSRMPSICSSANSTVPAVLASKGNASGPSAGYGFDEKTKAAHSGLLPCGTRRVAPALPQGIEAETGAISGQLKGSDFSFVSSACSFSVDAAPPEASCPSESKSTRTGADAQYEVQDNAAARGYDFPAPRPEKTGAEVSARNGADNHALCLRKATAALAQGPKGLESPTSCPASSLSTTIPDYYCGAEVGFGAQDGGEAPYFFSKAADVVGGQEALPDDGVKQSGSAGGLVKASAAQCTDAASGNRLTVQLSPCAASETPQTDADNASLVQANRGTSSGSEADRTLEMMLMMLTPLVAPGSKGASQGLERSANPPTASEVSSLIAKTIMVPFAAPVSERAASGDAASSAPTAVSSTQPEKSSPAANVAGVGGFGPRRTTETCAADSVASRDSNEEGRHAGIPSRGHVSHASPVVPPNGSDPGALSPGLSIHLEAARDGEKAASSPPHRQTRGGWVASKNGAGSSEGSPSVPSVPWSDPLSSPSVASLRCLAVSASSSALPLSLSSSPKFAELLSPPLSKASIRPPIALPPPVSSLAELPAVEPPDAPSSGAFEADVAAAADSAKGSNPVTIPQQLLVDLQLLLLLLFEHVCQLLPPLKRQDDGQFYAWHVQRLAAKAQATLFHYADLMAPLCTSSLFSQPHSGKSTTDVAPFDTPDEQKVDASPEPHHDSGFPHETATAALEALELCAQGRGNEKSAGWSLLALLLLQGLPPNASIFLSVSKCPVGRFLKVVGALERAYSLYKMVQGNGAESSSTPGGTETTVPGGESPLEQLPGVDCSDGVWQGRVQGGPCCKTACATSSSLLATALAEQNGSPEASHSSFSPPGRSVAGHVCGVPDSEAAPLAGIPSSAFAFEGAEFLAPAHAGSGNGEIQTELSVPETAPRKGDFTPRLSTERKLGTPTADRPGEATTDSAPQSSCTAGGLTRETGAASQLVSGAEAVGGEEEALATLLERQPLLQSDFASELFPGVALKGTKEDFCPNAASWQAALASAFSSPLCRPASGASHLGRSFSLPADACAPACGVAGTDSTDRFCRDGQAREAAGGCLSLAGQSRASKRSLKDPSGPGDAVQFGGAATTVQPSAAKKGGFGSGSGSRKSQKKQGAATNGTGVVSPASSQQAQDMRWCTSGSAGSASSFETSSPDAPSRLTSCGDLYLSASVNKRRHPSVQAEILKNCCTETLAERGTRLLDEVLQKLQHGGLQASPNSGTGVKEERGAAVSGGDGDRRTSESSRTSSLHEEETNTSSRRSRKSAGELALLATACMQPGQAPNGGEFLSGDAAAPGWWLADGAREPPTKCRRTLAGGRTCAETPGSASCEEQLLTLLRNATPTCAKGDLALGVALSPGKDDCSAAAESGRLGGAAAVSDLIKKATLGTQAGADVDFPSTFAKASGRDAECKKAAQFTGPLSGEQRALLSLGQASTKAFVPENCAEAAASGMEGRKKRGSASSFVPEQAAAPGSKTSGQLPGLLLGRGAPGAFGNSVGAMKGENGRTPNRMPGTKAEASPAGAAAAMAAGQDETMRGVFFNRSLNRWVCTWSRNGKEYQRSWSAGKYGYEAARQLARQCRLEKLLSGEAHTLQKGMAAVFKAPVGNAFPSTPNVLPSQHGSQSPAKETGERQAPQQARHHDAVPPAVLAEQARQVDRSGGASRAAAAPAEIPFESSGDRASNQNTDVLSLDRCCRLLLEQELAVALGDVRALCAEAGVAKGTDERKSKKGNDRCDKSLLQSLMSMQSDGLGVARKNSPGKKNAPATGRSDFGQMVMLMNACVERDHPCFEVSRGSSSSSSFPSGAPGDYTFSGTLAETQAEQVCFHDLA
ncbi:unnamed protein product [Neospora caninum Liverpool]|uniref:AP2 domain transcription factor AP2X-9 n=1 Tax=Neospora caninum (strain Liverpool) TaxID=572307 RepID=F0VL36_NEOCL|nr:uncharacterized protein NCLIV_052140 [Neospora caninum Liverpool]CBZ54788.1 unnamed protein product [Neospora caninum Liverpool]CEL69505.1 TPA: AP2 domain transcription factor AP2X-9 [Neospora caninum Liverpool]|eukprot:XP_003884816.1 uncharacterized protein NCLIV_052140 [Neospora caninum Liverpool]